MEKIKIALGGDHAGYAYKAEFIKYLNENGYECINVGTDTSDSVDYPIYAGKVCELVSSGECRFGILICGTGIGMSIAANKHKGIRAGLCNSTECARLTRSHNDANILCLGARVLSYENALEILKSFLSEQFMGEHHIRRIEMLNRLDNNQQI